MIKVSNVLETSKIIPNTVSSIKSSVTFPNQHNHCNLYWQIYRHIVWKHHSITKCKIATTFAISNSRGKIWILIWVQSIGKIDGYNATTLQWRHNEHESVSNHQPHDCLLNRLFRRRSKKTSKLRVTGLCAGNSAMTGEFPAQRASNTENVTIWWRHHEQTTVNLEQYLYLLYFVV